MLIHSEESLKSYRVANIHNSEEVNGLEKVSDSEVCRSLELYNHVTVFFLLLFVLHVNHTCFSALTRCSAAVGSLPY